MNLLTAYYAQFMLLSTEARATIEAGTVRQPQRRGDFLLRAGETANYLHYVESGVLRVYTQTERAEVTIWLGLANSLVVSLPSFIGRKPSVESIQVLDEAVISSIHYDTLQQLYEEFPELNRLGRLLIEQYAIQLREHGFSLRCHSTAERYQTLLQQRPELFKQVPLTHIASFLGMTPQAMSLIRAKRQ